MKLDNIIYDVDSLANAIAEQWNSESEAFKAMYPSDTAIALINVFAGYGCMLQYMLLGAVANCYTSTAFSKAGIYQLAETLGNNLHGNLSSQVLVAISKNNLITQEVTIPANTQFMIKGKKFFNPTAIILPQNSNFVEDIILVQGEILTVSQVTSGIPNEKFYFSDDFKANPNYIHVYINGEEWNVVDSFLEYDKNYIIDTTQMNSVMLKTEADGRSCIKVGDNQLAALPMSGSNIVIEYVSNDGSNGNISEVGVNGSLLTSLIEFDQATQTNEALSLNIITTSTAFGGANTQSIDILRYSSPYVFASGHRAVRRQDYIAMLLNECGYLAANVWGEYEEAEKIGAYDALMMNMVYYTGIKSFQTYPEFTVGRLTKASDYTGTLNSTTGFWGSFSIIINNLTTQAETITFKDNGANGYLFIDDNEQDPRDSILPLWKAALADEDDFITSDNDTYNTEPGYEDAHSITNACSDNTDDNEYYASMHEPTLQKPVQIFINFDELPDENPYKNGAVISGFKLKESTKVTYPGTVAMFATRSLTTFTEDRINIRNSKNWDKIVPRTKLENPSTKIRTDADGNPRIDYWSDWISTNTFTGESSQGQPVFSQNYKYYVIEFYSSSAVTLPTAVIGFKSIKFLLSDDASILYYKNQGKFALKFPESTSPGPSQDDTPGTTINMDLINTDAFPLYNYITSISDVTTQNDYRDGNMLAYKYLDQQTNDITTFMVKVINTDLGSCSVYLNNSTTLVGKSAINIENGSLSTTPVYEETVAKQPINPGEGYTNNSILYLSDGTTENIVPTLRMKPLNVSEGGKITSLTLLPDPAFDKAYSVGAAYVGEFNTYCSDLDARNCQVNISAKTCSGIATDITIVNGGSGYAVGDKVHVSIESMEYMATIYTVDAGEVKGLKLEVADSSESSTHGTGLVISMPNRNGRGGKIRIDSSENLTVTATFTGNRIDSEDLTQMDQPIIKKYNHFTTYIEFKQPAIRQEELLVQVSLQRDLAVTSGIVIQNISNALYQLFNLKPDSIGQGIKLSKLYTTIMNVEGVEWCKVIEPTGNIDVEINELLVPSKINIIDVTET